MSSGARPTARGGPLADVEANEVVLAARLRRTKNLEFPSIGWVFISPKVIRISFESLARCWGARGSCLTAGQAAGCTTPCFAYHVSTPSGPAKDHGVHLLLQ